MTKPDLFRALPVVVEAVRWDGADNSAARIVAWLVEHQARATRTAGRGLAVQTAGGWVDVHHGDYVVRVGDDRFEVHTADQFRTRHQPAVSAPPTTYPLPQEGI